MTQPAPAQTPPRHAGLVPASTDPHTHQPPLARDGGPRNESGATEGADTAYVTSTQAAEPDTAPTRHAGPVPASTDPHPHQPHLARDGGPRNESGATEGAHTAYFTSTQAAKPDTAPTRHAGPVPASTDPHTHQPPLARDGGPRNKSGVTMEAEGGNHTSPCIPRATYRIQFHKGFTFADAQGIVPYLAGLGISHLYASPITTAAPGSTHGYDVVDPTAINPELGGEDGFRSLAAALRAHGMGAVIDIVPNHMGVATGTNAWWQDVLTHGRASDYAPVFDIDWRHRIVLPVLGDPLPTALANGDIAAERHDDRWWVVAYGEHRFPVRDADQGEAGSLPIAVLLDRQHYRLAWWRTANDHLNWRRFFTVNELAGVRIEDPAVFDRTHALVLRLWSEGLIDGVRIDHVDGLTDPAAYCRQLRERLDTAARAPDAPPRPAWIVVEKILAEGEPMATDWGIDGTSGYDFMEQVAALLHDPAGADPLGRAWAKASGRSAGFAPEELRARQDMLAWQFSGQLEGCVDAFSTLAHATREGEGLTRAMLRRAIERLLWVFPVYRTYGTGAAAPAADAAIRDTVRQRVAPHVPPGEGAVVDLILSWLGGTGPAIPSGDPALAAEAVRRFQQLSAPIAAKAVEDTAFYRYGRLLSRNDVGFAADLMGLAPAAFHAAMQARAKDWPHAMLTTATHDHKRGEDTRARLAVLSAAPDAWIAAHARLDAIAADHDKTIDGADRYMLLQSLLGAWPEDGTPAPTPAVAFADRIVAWQQKALREGKLRSSWEDPQEDYETRAEALARALIADPAFVAEMNRLLSLIAPAAAANALVQAALRCTVPGVPDLYQGAEFTDLSLVDPDNRRPVDFAAPPGAKAALIRDLLALRRDHPALFAEGDYRPAPVTGPAAGHVLAFTRRCGDAELRVAVALHPGTRPHDWTGTDIRYDGETITAAMAFSSGPVRTTFANIRSAA